MHKIKNSFKNENQKRIKMCYCGVVIFPTWCNFSFSKESQKRSQVMPNVSNTW